MRCDICGEEIERERDELFEDVYVGLWFRGWILEIGFFCVRVD